jgi:FkbM family methyltransferase
MVSKARRLLFNLLRWLGHQDWLGLETRRRIIKNFVNHNTIGPWEFETDFFGLKYQGNLNDLIDWFVYFFGAYEKAELFLLRDLVAPLKAPVFIDVGASTGQHSLYMSRFCYRVHAFEPYDQARKILLTRIAANHIANIVVHEVALGAREEFLDFYAPVGHNVGVGSFLPFHRTTHRIIANLKLVNGDDYLARQGVGKIDLIKIDVEGFEKYVLQGLKETLIKYRPVVVMEFSRSSKKTFSTPQEFWEIMPKDYALSEVVFAKKSLISSRGSLYRLQQVDFGKLYEVDPCNTNLLLQPV